MGYVISGLGLFLMWVQVFGQQSNVYGAAIAGVHELHVLSMASPLQLAALLLVAAAGWEVRAVLITDTVSSSFARRRFLRTASMAIICVFMLRTFSG